mgnify:CR=1 FL=1
MILQEGDKGVSVKKAFFLKHNRKDAEGNGVVKTLSIQLPSLWLITSCPSFLFILRNSEAALLNLNSIILKKKIFFIVMVISSQGMKIGG